MSRSSDRVVYRWARQQLVRPLGVLVAVLGVLWLLLTILVTALGGSGRSWYLGLAALSLLALSLGAARFARPPAVIELSAEGYRLRNLRGGGALSRRWKDVTSVTTGPSVAGPVLVLEGRAGAPSVVPLALLGADAGQVEERVRMLLEAAHRDGSP